MLQGKSFQCAIQLNGVIVPHSLISPCLQSVLTILSTGMIIPESFQYVHSFHSCLSEVPIVALGSVRNLHLLIDIRK